MNRKGLGKKVLLLSLFCGSSLAGFADTVTVEGQITFPTYRVERKAFQGNTTEQITIPEGVTFIDQQAFADCSNLSSISFPATLQDIENSFVNCPELESVDLLSASKLRCLVGSFEGCTGLTTVSLPENLEEIGKGTFEDCSSLTSVSEIPSVRFIGSNAFKGTGLSRTPLLDKVDHIGNGAFETGKPILWDFGEYSWIDDPLRAGERLLEIYPEATGIRSVNQLSLNPSTLALTEKTLAQFPWKESVQVLSLHPEFQTLESLKGLVNLKDLEIPEGYRLSKISNSIFEDCIDLEAPTFICSTEVDGVFYTIPTEDLSIQSALVLYGAQALSDETFQDCKDLSIVRLPDDLQFIGKKAFSGCTALTSLELPDSIESIGSEAFLGCSLQALALPDSLQSIGNKVFAGCSNLELINFPDLLETIGNEAFSGCSSLISLVLPDSVQSIEDGTFTGCSSLTSIVLPTSLCSLGCEAFSECLKLASITFPKSLRSVGKKAFAGCTDLSQLYGVHQVPQLEENVFENCSGLGVLQIFPYDEQKVMTGMPKANLQTAIILQGTESIGENAFLNCTSLISLLLPESLKTIKKRLFRVVPL